MDGILDRLAALAFPVRCPGCGRPGAPVCGRCLAGVRPAPPAPPPLGLVAWSAAFAYEGVVREAVARAKYHGSHASLRGLGDHAASAWHDLAAQAGLARPDVVTWAPTAPARRRARGVDHARVLAQVVAARLGVPA
ncbi:MAG: ComF family protein, partial [Actinomycetes bacterium]